ncbi:hypothetical protein BH23GEM9_BH23GEM9_30860 [soil metagenome]
MGAAVRHLAVVMAVVVSGCSDSSGPGDMVPAALVGTWVAEPACLPLCGFTLSSVANPADSVNATAVLGIETEISMTRAGVFRLVTRPGPPSLPGTVRAEAGNILVVTDALGVVDTLDYTASATHLHLRFRRTFLAFDFTGDGTFDPANARGSFQRRP